MKTKASIIFLAALVISACGGGGGGGGGTIVAPPPPPPPPAAVSSGQFKDANTEGLSFSTPSESGTTDSNGSFSYRTGEIVEFSVGAVVIGSTVGQPIVTPIDLIANGSSINAEVTNIVRFLMMLDQNEDPADGITISSAVRTAAANWTQVDFATNDLDNELVSIISDVASVDSRVASLPAENTAQSHLESTLHCQLSGFFVGTRTISGVDAGSIYIFVSPATGILRASYAGNTVDLISAEPVSADLQRGFNATRAADSDNVEGRFDSYDALSGVWAIGGDAGEFTASRWSGDSSPRYRFVGEYASRTPSRLEGVLAFDVDATGAITGDSTTLSLAAEKYPLNGTLSGQDISMVSSADWTFDGTIDAALFVSDEYVAHTGDKGVWRAEGCRLN